MSRYKNLKNILLPGDIILTHNSKVEGLGEIIVSRGIEWFTDGDYSHCIWVNFPWIYHWTTWRAKKEKLKSYLKSDYKICVMRYEELTIKQVKMIEMYANQDVKDKRIYASKSYFGYALFNAMSKIPLIGKGLSGFFRRHKNPWRARNQRVCSSGIIQRWFKKAGIDICPELGDEQVTPEDIFLSDKLRIVYREEI